MKIYRLNDGQPYVGEPVDCRELMMSGNYTSTEPTEDEMSAHNEAKAAEDEDIVVRSAKGTGTTARSATKAKK
jgi:hypothetical protein